MPCSYKDWTKMLILCSLLCAERGLSVLTCHACFCLQNFAHSLAQVAQVLEDGIEVREEAASATTCPCMGLGPGLGPEPGPGMGPGSGLGLELGPGLSRLSLTGLTAKGLALVLNLWRFGANPLHSPHRAS